MRDLRQYFDQFEANRGGSGMPEMTSAVCDRSVPSLKYRRRSQFSSHANCITAQTLM